MTKIRSRASKARRFTTTVATALVLGTAALASFPLDAAAQETGEEPMKVLVGKLDGAKTSSARSWIIEGLNADPRFEVVGSADGDEVKTGASEAQIGEAAMGLSADAVILGASRFGKGWSAELHIHDGKDGHLIEKANVKGPSFGNYEANLKGGADYFQIITKAEGFPPPPPPEPEVEVEEPEEVAEPAPVEEEPSGDARPSPLDVMPGFRLYSRAFRYTGTLNQIYGDSYEPMVDYNLDAGPMPFINLHWYPAAHAMDGIPAHIGITGGYEMGIATKVKYGEEVLNQNHTLWYAGLRGRIPVSMFTFGLEAKYGNHAFSLKTAEGNASDDFPNTSYTFVEAGIDGEAQVGELLLGAQASYLYLLGAGDLVSEAWFPTASGRGVHFSGYAGWAASKVVHLLGGVDARAYGFDFNPLPEGRTAPDPVAGGATDRYLSFWIGARFRIPEKGGAAASSGGDSDSGGGSDSGGDFDSFD